MVEGEISLRRAICPITTTCTNQHGVNAKDVHGRLMHLDLTRKIHQDRTRVCGITVELNQYEAVQKKRFNQSLFLYIIFYYLYSINLGGDLSDLSSVTANW